MIQFVKKQLKGSLVGAEAGVYAGDNAVNILSSIPNVKRLYLIDPYKTDYWVWKTSFLKTLPKAKQTAFRQLTRFKERVIWIYEEFEASLIPEPLDFIYIDGCHSYESVKHDIREAEEIVKHGGVIGGHDYYPNGVNEHRFGVGCAVREHYGHRLRHRETDWWVVYESPDVNRY